MNASEQPSSPPSKTRWHLLLGAVLEPLLQPVGVDVLTELPVMKTPPKADILLLRRSRSSWSPEQTERLPDGIRDSEASHILIEFKYTESLNEQAICQAVGYDYFYRQAHDLEESAVQTVLVSAKTPRSSTLRELGYIASAQKGVFRSGLLVIRKILVLSLNDLANTPHNAPIKCFASRNRERLTAFTTLKHQRQARFSERFWWMINGLWDVWFYRGGDTMAVSFSPEEITEMGKMWGKHLLSRLSVEERLAGLKPEEVLRNYKPEEVLRNYKPEEVLRNYKPEEVLQNYKPEEIERYLRKLKEDVPEDKSSRES